jgi:O-antigen/teichoic acid export membrane protein
MFETLRSWSQDRLLRGVVKSSGYLFSSNTISAALSLLQGIFATRLLGVDGYGLASGTIIVFASNTNRLLSFRMSEVVVKYLGQALAEGNKDRAGAVAKGIGLVEAATSVVAYLVLLLLAPWAARTLAKDAHTASLFTFYGLVLLANLIYETSTGVLQATKRFDRIALINLIQSILTATLILTAFLLNGNVKTVLAAYLVGKTFAGLAVAMMAFRQLNVVLGPSWWRVSLRLLPDWRGIAGFAINTNLNGTVNLLVRDNAPLYLGALRSPTEVGYFKLAQTILNLVMLPIEPFIWPTYAEITRTIAQRQWEITRRLLKRVSAIAGAWTLAAAGGIALLGWWFIPLLYGSDTRPTYPAVLFLLVGYGFANTLNWNRPLLLALGKPFFPLAVAAIVGAVEIALTFWLVPIHGYLAEAAILSGFFVVSIAVIVWRGMKEISGSEIRDS